MRLGRRRQPLPRPARRHRGQRARPRPPGRGRGGHASRSSTLGHVSNLFVTEPPVGARRAAARAARRRGPGVLRQLRRRGQRGGVQAVPAHRPHPRGRHRGRLPRPHDGRAGADRPAGQGPRARSGRCPASVTHVPYGDADALAAAVTDETAMRRSWSRSRARTAWSSRPPGYLAGGPGDHRRARRAARCSTRCRPASAAPAHWFAHQADGRRARRGHPGQGARRRPADRRLRRLRREPARPARAGHARHHLRRQPGRLRGRARGARHHRRRRACSTTSSEVGERLRRGIEALGHPLVAEVRGAGCCSASCSPSRWPARSPPRPCAQRASSSTPAQPDAIRLAPPLILTADAGRRVPRRLAGDPRRRRRGGPGDGADDPALPARRRPEPRRAGRGARPGRAA